MKRTNSFVKDDELYQFILKNGFSCSIEKMALGIKVEKKTLFNRYQNKQNLETTIRNHWRILFIDRLYAKFEKCNNNLEKLFLFILELKKSYYEEAVFFQKDKNLGSFCSETPKHPFLLILETIINEGQKENFFQQLNTTLYSSFLLYHLIYLYLEMKQDNELIMYMLTPLLTNKGTEYYRQIDLNYFLQIF